MTGHVVVHQLTTEEEEEGASLFDLVVTVPHILDARNGGEPDRTHQSGGDVPSEERGE